MTLKDTHTFGKNKKNLILNLICQFTLNKWEDKITPQVKIMYFDSKEDKGNKIENVIEDIKENTIKKTIATDDIDDDFIF